MKGLIRGTLAVLGLALLVSVPKAHAAYDPVKMCAASRGYNSVPTMTNGTLVADSSGCVTFDASKDTAGSDMRALINAGFQNKGVALPWGITPIQQASATPTCTFVTDTSMACINKMGANETSLTLASMVAGKYYTMIFLQDGTGARTLAQTAITGSPGLASNTTAANTYDVWLIKATSATAATWVRSYPNMSLKGIAKYQVASAGTAIAPLAAQALPTVVMPGMTANDVCTAVPSGAVDSTWSLDFVKPCNPQTNAAIVSISNPNATVTTTPSATNINIAIASY